MGLSERHDPPQEAGLKCPLRSVSAAGLRPAHCALEAASHQGGWPCLLVPFQGTWRGLCALGVQPRLKVKEHIRPSRLTWELG